jgi:hypothetical protein
MIIIEGVPHLYHLSLNTFLVEMIDRNRDFQYLIICYCCYMSIFQWNLRIYFSEENIDRLLVQNNSIDFDTPSIYLKVL